MRALVGGVTATELRRVSTVPEPVFGALLDGLRDPNPQVRFWVIQLLDHVADPRAFDAVAGALDDPVDRVRRNAVHALGCLACKPGADLSAVSDEVLARVADMAGRDPSPKVRAVARWALACHTPPA